MNETDLLKALKFTSTAVARKDFIPELMHFKIKDGRVTTFNGRIALSSPIDLDLDVQPAAVSLISAIRSCEETIALNVTPTGKLAVKSGRFKAFINCLPDQSQYLVEPEGADVELGDTFLHGLQEVAPLMGIDASRPWSMGVKISGPMMYATNNIMLAKYWHSVPSPVDVIIPSDAVNEILRIDENPQRMQATENSATFHFSGDRWLRTQLIEPSGWPGEAIKRALDRELGDQHPMPEFLNDALDTLAPFLNERNAVYLTQHTISTSQHDSEGASVEVTFPGITEMQAYNHHNLNILFEVAITIDWSSYPNPCVFEGWNMLGVILGQRII